MSLCKQIGIKYIHDVCYAIYFYPFSVCSFLPEYFRSPSKPSICIYTSEVKVKQKKRIFCALCLVSILNVKDKYFCKNTFAYILYTTPKEQVLRRKKHKILRKARFVKSSNKFCRQTGLITKS